MESAELLNHCTDRTDIRSTDPKSHRYNLELGVLPFYHVRHEDAQTILGGIV